MSGCQQYEGDSEGDNSGTVSAVMLSLAYIHIKTYFTITLCAVCILIMPQ